MMNSYIKLHDYSEPYFNGIIVDTGFVKLENLPDKMDELKFTNTMMIINYHCMENDAILKRYKFCPSILSSMYSKMVCQKFNYTYTKPYQPVDELLYHNWHNININMLDLCAIAYHIKNRQYRNLMHTLESMKFNMHTLNVVETLRYTLTLTLTKITNKKFRAAIISIMFSYIRENIKEIMLIPDLPKTIVKKSVELLENMRDFKGYPQYIKKYIINSIQTTAQLLSSS
jgi:hypothetical protein